jgi:hypothetical protein
MNIAILMVFVLHALVDKPHQEGKLNAPHVLLAVIIVLLLMGRKYAQPAWTNTAFLTVFVLHALVDKLHQEGKLNAPHVLLAVPTVLLLMEHKFAQYVWISMD